MTPALSCSRDPIEANHSEQVRRTPNHRQPQTVPTKSRPCTWSKDPVVLGRTSSIGPVGLCRESDALALVHAGWGSADSRDCLVRSELPDERAEMRASSLLGQWPASTRTRCRWRTEPAGNRSAALEQLPLCVLAYTPGQHSPRVCVRTILWAEDIEEFANSSHTPLAIALIRRMKPNRRILRSRQL